MTEEQVYTVFEVKVEQQHVRARSREEAAAKYFDEHPEVEDVRVLAEASRSDGDWFDLARDLTDSEYLAASSRHPCERCGGPAFDGECADPACNAIEGGESSINPLNPYPLVQSPWGGQGKRS